MNIKEKLKILKQAATATPKNMETTGNCYQEAASMILDTHRDWILVHGRPTLAIPPYIEYGHAWIESPDREVVIDPSGREMPRAVYYAFGNIDSDDNIEYTSEEAREKVIEFKHWGPWEGVDAEPPTEMEEDYEEEMEW